MLTPLWGFWIVWFFIWFVVSIFILGIFGWSVRILLQQKSAWQGFAKKMNLTYQQPKGFLVSPVVTGAIGPFGFALFSEPQATADSRGQRYTSILEFSLRQGLPAIGAVGTAQVMNRLEGFPGDKPVAVADKDWDANWFVRTDNVGITEKYLTPSRIEFLRKVFRLKIIAGFFLYTPEDAILRLETADPLNSVERLEKVVKGVTAQLGVMIPSAEEKAAFPTPAPIAAPPAAPVPKQ